MAYPTLAELKDRLSIAGSDQDVALQAALSAAIGAVQGYCGYEWENTDPVVRTYERMSYVPYRSSFNVSYPGLLSASGLTAIGGGQRQDLEPLHYDFVRYSPAGFGPYDVVKVDGLWDRLEITGIWGQGTEAPAEVSAVVMILAMRIYTLTLGGGYVDDSDPTNPATWKGSEIAFLLAGHRRAR